MPVLEASGAGVRNRHGWLFRDLDIAVAAGELAAVVGPPGSGRTTLLLTLADRFRLSAGRVRRTGVVALGHVPGVNAPEPVFTVAEHVRERLLLLGRPTREAAAVLADQAYGLDPTLRGWQLSPYQRQLLGLTLARLSRPQLIALDGVDDGLDGVEQAQLWQALTGLTEQGLAVVVTAREVDPSVVTTVIRLGGSPPAEPGAEPAAEPGAEPAAEPAAEPGAELTPRAAARPDTDEEKSR